MKIGVFDSGVGGKSVAQAIEKGLPGAEVVFKNDTKHVPYGDKSLSNIYNYTLPILNMLSNLGCDVIVVACNTVSTNLITELRQVISVPLIAIEPMVKPAAQLTQSNIIVVCATPMTLQSQRYKQLKDRYAKSVKVLEPDCSDWSYMIEHKQIDEVKIKELTHNLIEQGADVIVLGCTHYHWIEQVIQNESKQLARVIQPEQAVLAQIKNVLERLKT